MLLREWREFKGMSREELAVTSGTTYSTIANLESGRHEPRIGLASRIASALGVNLNDIRWEPEPPDLMTEKAAYVLALQAFDRQAQERLEASVSKKMRQLHLSEAEIAQTLDYLRDLAARSKRQS